ncbi:TPA: hypothetical protein ACJGY0_002622 [Salmonella enterica subsp. enterica serovar Mississippi]
MTIQRFRPVAPSAIMLSEQGDYVRYNDHLERLNLSTAAADVLAERHRQITVKGWTPEHDDTYIGFELAAAAISYIEPMEAENYWPADWHDDSFRPSDYRRNLVKAAALLLAEIERLDRQSQDAHHG